MPMGDKYAGAGPMLLQLNVRTFATRPMPLLNIILSTTLTEVKFHSMATISFLKLIIPRGMKYSSHLY